jgi:hypothetical protein
LLGRLYRRVDQRRICNLDVANDMACSRVLRLKGGTRVRAHEPTIHEASLPLQRGMLMVKLEGLCRTHGLISFCVGDQAKQ